jgi:hypothetical protein
MRVSMAYGGIGIRAELHIRGIHASWRSTLDRQSSKEYTMPLNPVIKKNWIEIQKKHAVPVNAIGVKIDPKDERTLTVWRDEGIDQYMKR